MTSAVPLELFHLIADDASAQVRRYVVDHELESGLRFRNLAFDEAMEDFHARGGQTPPALWDGTRLYAGAQACISRLSALADVGRNS